MRIDSFISTKNEALLLEAEEGTSLPKAIVDVPQIDCVLHEFQPDVAHLTKEENDILFHEIEHHLFGHGHVHHKAHSILHQEEILHFLDGMRSLAKLHHIHDFKGLQHHFNHKIASFNPKIVCDVK